jgi:hypothetical protein
MQCVLFFFVFRFPSAKRARLAGFFFFLSATQPPLIRLFFHHPPSSHFHFHFHQQGEKGKK